MSFGIKKADVVVGAIYAVKVSGKISPVRIDRAYTKGYDGTNLRTGRGVHLRSAQRLRRRIWPTTDGGFSVVAPG